MKRVPSLIFAVFLASCSYRPITYQIWAEANAEDRLKIIKTADNIEVVKRLRSSGRVITENDDFILVRYGSSDYVKTYGKVIAETPVTVVIDGVLIFLALGGMK